METPEHQDTGSRLGRAARNLAAKKLVKVAGKAALKGVLFLLKATAPVWVPLLIIMLVTWSAYMVIYAFPKEMIESNIGGRSLIAAFFGVSEDDEQVFENEQLFERYREISEGWSEGLDESQRNQAYVHKFPWSVLVATDRVVNDKAVWEGGERVEIEPEEVFEMLRPRFEWTHSTITTTTVSCQYVEDEDGKGGVVCTTSTTTEHVSLIARADTLEGTFLYEYEWKTDTTPDNTGGSVTVARQVLSHVTPPEEYFKPWKEYLALKGITDEMTIELVQELAMLYDGDYRINHALVLGLDYSSYPTVEGANGWLWPTPSTRITSPYGPRTYPFSGFHAGVDVGAAAPGTIGDPIWSMDDGVVTFVGMAGGYGKTVLVDHGNGVNTRYAHLDRILVSRGQEVDRGTTVGTLGNTGRSTGPHLHFEIVIDGRQLDPKFFFR
jgi:hypothetical protein